VKAVDLEIWVRRVCALVVAAVAAYASYVHQREFALQGGADETSAALWPLSVDGLLLLSTVGLLKPTRPADRRARAVVWVAFLFGIGVSLAANIAAAPALAWKPVLVAGWPPVALLLSVELLAHRDRGREDTRAVSREDKGEKPEQEVHSFSAPRSGKSEKHAPPRQDSRGTPENGTGGSRPSAAGRSAEAVMWEHYQRERAAGRTPSGTELDRAAGTNNYGRAVLRQWRKSGRIPAAPTVQPLSTSVEPTEE